MIAFLFVLLSALTGRGAAVELWWTHSPSTNVTGYRIYWGTNSRSYQWFTNTARVTNLIINGLAYGKLYFFTAVATAGTNQSDYSNECGVTMLPQYVNLSSVLLVSSNPAGPWLKGYQWPEICMPITNGKQYYKAKIDISQ